MSFSSLSFLFYFLPASLLLYYLFSFSITFKNIILLVCSLVFYAFGEPKNIYILILSILVNYGFGLLIGYTRNSKKRKIFFLVLSIVFNLALLFVFKYLSSAVQTVNYFMTSPIDVGQFTFALPVGISFFTFQAISYGIDVYRGRVGVQKNLLNFALYLSFFPKLTQGPITKYTDFEPQIYGRKETVHKFSSGVCFFLVGLGKKVLLANSMAIVADRIFSLQQMEKLPVGLAWMGAIAYTFQIYFDFSGYSDMAIGLGLMFGFELPRNFWYPYISKSIGEFWRRWHITLGAWFRDYLYIPLGGSRMRNQDKVIRNLAVVWIATGVWHGANWTFLAWGILNFICIAWERVFHFEKMKVPNAVRHLYALLVIVLGWVLFRSDSLPKAMDYIQSMFNFVQNGFWNDYASMFLKEFWVFFVLCTAFSMPVVGIVNQFLAKGILTERRISKEPPYDEKSVYMEAPFHKVMEILYPVGMILLFVVCVSYLVKGSYNPFIYFQF